MILKTHQIVAIGHQVFLTQLHGSIRNSTGLWIDQPDWFHWAKSKRVATSAGHFFDRQTAFKILSVFEAVKRYLFRRHQCIVKPLILLFRKWAIDVIITAFSVTSGFENDVVINRLSIYDRRDCVIEI